MKCSNCGTENPDYAVYCFQCGGELQVEPTYEEPEAEPVEETVEPQTPRPAQTPFSQQRPVSYGQPLPRGNGVLILIFGILGLVFCMPLGVVAWIMGSSDLQKMHMGFISSEEKGITQAGKVLGIISVVLFLMIIGFIIMMVSLGTHFGGPNMWEL